MKRLTHKNYEKLPEIRKKKEDQQKVEDLKVKKQKAAQQIKELDARVRQKLKEKQLQKAKGKKMDEEPT